MPDPEEGILTMQLPASRGPVPPHPSQRREVYDSRTGRTGIVLEVLGGRLTLGPADAHEAPWHTNISNVSLLFPLDTYPAERL